nr:phospholipid-transporting ATPase ID-like [Penaeus vannamei]
MVDDFELEILELEEEQARRRRRSRVVSSFRRDVPRTSKARPAPVLLDHVIEGWGSKGGDVGGEKGVRAPTAKAPTKKTPPLHSSIYETLNNLFNASTREIETERRIKPNNPEFNAQFNYAKNYIKTSKYTLLNFIPYNLFEQFQRLANFYFLCLLVLQLIPVISSLTPVTTAVPLIGVLMVTGIKDAYDDYTNLKSKQCLPETEEFGQDVGRIGSFQGEIRCEPPNNQLNKFDGTLYWDNQA